MFDNVYGFFMYSGSMRNADIRILESPAGRFGNASLWRVPPALRHSQQESLGT